MQVFVPYTDPLTVARCLDSKRLNKQIIECHQIIDAIEGTGKGWFNHPVVKMYKDHLEWLKDYTGCLARYQQAKTLKNMSFEDALTFTGARLWSDNASCHTPYFLTQEFCDQHRRRLYTKNPDHYRQFSQYGRSEENWYCIDGQVVRYINGKKL